MIELTEHLTDAQEEVLSFILHQFYQDCEVGQNLWSVTDIFENELAKNKITHLMSECKISLTKAISLRPDMFAACDGKTSSVYVINYLYQAAFGRAEWYRKRQPRYTGKQLWPREREAWLALEYVVDWCHMRKENDDC